MLPAGSAMPINVLRGGVWLWRVWISFQGEFTCQPRTILIMSSRELLWVNEVYVELVVRDAMTVHKLQGLAFDYVCLVLPIAP